MQRILSMQMSRGFGESSEFVTKRSCIAFLFSIGFLALLGGFMLGRFAAQRNMMVRAEQTRMQLANNGLEMTEHLQSQVFEFLQGASFVEDLDLLKAINRESNFQTDFTISKDIFPRLGIIQQIFKFKSCTVAKVQGSRESDRYVVISLIEKTVKVVIELVESLNKVHEQQAWSPRRTILFCTCENSSEDCFDELPSYMQSKIVAFIIVADNSLRTSNLFVDCLLISGSNIVQTAVLKAVDSMNNFNSKAISVCNERELISVPRLDLDIPHAILSFVNGNSSLSNGDKKILAQVIGLSIWRLSESIILPWNPKSLNKTILQSLVAIESSKAAESSETRVTIENLNKLIDKIANYTENFNVMETTNSLNVRIANDLLLDLDETLLCLDKQNRSLKKIEECSKNVQGILQA